MIFVHNNDFSFSAEKTLSNHEEIFVFFGYRVEGCEP